MLQREENVGGPLCFIMPMLRFWCCPVWRQPQTTQNLRKNKTSDGKLWRKTMNNHEEKRWITWITIWKNSTLPDPKHQNHRGRVAHCRNPDHRSHPDAWSLQPCKASATMGNMGNWPPHPTPGNPRKWDLAPFDMHHVWIKTRDVLTINIHQQIGI